MTDQNAADLISVPQGGGAISGIGETFQPDLHTGTGNLTIPLQLPRGRNGLQPSLSLSYSTGNPNGPFGFGWSLSVPGVRRKTDEGIPRYHPDLDTFVLSGAEDLIPMSGLGTDTVRYRPRSEAGYARITHLTGAGSDYWEVWSADGLRSHYGTPVPSSAPQGWTDPAIIAGPDLTKPGKVFAWLLTETMDPLGNKISYTYQADHAGSAQRYLSQVSYADYGDNPASPQYLVTVKIVLDPNPRPDPFSDHRPGFELRTTQRIAAIETWTNAGTPLLARRMQLSYADETGIMPANAVSLLTRVTVTGINGHSNQALPPLELGYTPWDPAARRYQPLGATAAQVPATSLAGPGLDLVDMFGDGLASILQLNGSARYWRNKGDGSLDLPHSLAYVPAGVNLGDPGVQLADLDGDGRPDLLVSTPDRTGYWPMASNGGFDPAGYVSVSPAPTVSLSDPLVRLIDLDGDGVTDALRTGDQFELFYSDKGAAFNRVQVLKRGDVPDVTFGDPRVFLADMTGDGLTDLVLVHDRNITYSPYQGYGSWGAKVVMENAPVFSDAAAYPGTGFDPRRLLLGDVDGDGCADVVYVGDGTVTVWINQAGNKFADKFTIRGTPRAAGASIRLADMNGTGTAGILWSYDLGTVRGSNYKFLDLTGGTKPYLLSRIDNHAGAVTTINYAPSTAYATADRSAGHPWQTTLPFPVQVVASTSVTDYFSQNTLTSQYFYHHGAWDGADRQFAGFARVDRRDTLTPTGSAPNFYSPPTETRTWFHVGPVGSESRWTDGVEHLCAEYWAGDQILTPHVDASALTAMNLPNREMRYAARALRGRVLRSELYSLDGDADIGNPYQISDHAYVVAFVQASDPQWQASSPVATVQPVLDRTSVWERGTDPLTTATVTGGYDSYGRPHQTVQVAVPRGRDLRLPSPGASPYLATTTLTDYATRDDDTLYLISRVSLQQRLKLAEDTTAGLPLIKYALLQLAVPATPVAGNIRALTLTYYDGQAFEGMPNGQLGDWGLRTRVESLALTPDILAAAYQAGDTTIPLPPYLEPGTPAWTADYPQAFRDLTVPLAGYRYQPGQPPYLAGWYTQQERIAYDVQDQGTGRGLVTARLDPLGNKTTISYDDPYQLLPAAVTDPAGLTRSATYDYRVLRPSQVTDANGNRIELGYTPLGLPAWIAATGKRGADQGDTPAQPGTTFTYDLTGWDDNPANPQPMSVHTTRRVEHRWTMIDQANAQLAEQNKPLLTDAQIAAMFPPDETSQYPDRFIQKTDFADGFSRLLQTRTQGDNIILDDLGLTGNMDTKPGPVVTHQQDPAAPPKVVVSGWQTYDNKGQVIEQYEPFFGSGWGYQQPAAAQLASLAKVTTQYDPRGLAIRAIYPDGSEVRLIPGVPPDLTNPDHYTPTPWETYRYDQNDNAGRTNPGTSAGWSSHRNTPASDLIDPLGRIIEHIERTATTILTTQNTYDIDGNLLQVTDPFGRVASQQTYDLERRPWRQQLIDAGTTRIVLDAANGAVERRDSKGALRLAATDALRRPLRAWARDRTDGNATLREAFVYGDNQAESGLQPSDAAAVNLFGKSYHTYDEAGRAETTSYDLDGNLLEKTRRVLSTQTLMSALPGPAGDWTNAYYQADWQPPAGQTLAQNAASLLDPTAYAVSTTYDALARPTSVTAPLDADGYRKTLHPTYSRAGTLTALDLDGASYVQQILYNARGQRALAILGCATMIRYAYDPQTFRLARLRSEPTTPASPPRPASPPPVQDYGYAYDLVGNLLTLDDRTPGSGIGPVPDMLTRTFSYDPLYRLTSATGRECDIPPPTPWPDTPRCTDLTKVRAYTENYTYDNVGCLLNFAHQASTGSFTRTYTVQPGTNQAITMTSGQTAYQYGYDASGNTVSETTCRLFEWNHANQLATFRNQTPNAEPTLYTQYRYDTAGQRVLKIVRKHGNQLAVTTYVGGHFERLTLADASGTSNHDTLHVLDTTACVASVHAGPVIPGDASPPVAYHLRDHLRSSTVVLDSSGALFNREEYTPYGETSFGSYAKKRYRHASKERDEESGLYYYGARYYTPWLGRWTSPDPVGMHDGTNQYQYVQGNPLTKIDPTGLAADDAQNSASLTGTTDAETAAQQQAKAGAKVEQQEGEAGSDEEAPPPKKDRTLLYYLKSWGSDATKSIMRRISPVLERLGISIGTKEFVKYGPVSVGEDQNGKTDVKVDVGPGSASVDTNAKVTVSLEPIKVSTDLGGPGSVEVKVGASASVAPLSSSDKLAPATVSADVHAKATVKVDLGGGAQVGVQKEYKVSTGDRDVLFGMKVEGNEGGTSNSIRGNWKRVSDDAKALDWDEPAIPNFLAQDPQKR